MQRACSLLSASQVCVPPCLVSSNICLAATKPCRAIYAETHCPIRGPSRQSRLPDETLGEMKGGSGEEGRIEGKHIQELEGEEDEGG